MSIVDSVKLPEGDVYDVMAKLDGATLGNIATYDVNENLSDSGIPVSAIGQKQTKELETPLVIGGTTETTVEGALGGLNDEKQDNLDLTSETETGNPLSFTTDSEQVAQNVAITFEPIQAGSGDPSPSNVRAISGYDSLDVVASGKNLVDSEILDANINTSGTVITQSSGTYYYVLYVGRVVKGVTYTVRSAEANLLCGFFTSKPKMGSVTYDGSRTLSEGTLTFTAPITGYVAYRSAWTTPVPSNYGQMEVGTTLSEYEPYTANEVTLKLNETFYSGTLDVESGKLVVTHKAVDMGSLTWGYSDSTFTSSIRDGAFDSNDDFLCEIYKPDTSGLNNTIAINRNTKVVYARDSNYSSASTFKTAVTGKKIVYKLTTPITIQLPPAQVKLLQGANVVTTNGTSMSLTYRNGEVAKLSDLRGLADSINADVVKASNPNLLLNPWFTINQRGFSSGSYSSLTYCVDRWQVTKDVALTTNGITLTPNNGDSALRQTFELSFTDSLLNKEVCASALLSDGTILNGSANIGTLDSLTILFNDVENSGLRCAILKPSSGNIVVQYATTKTVTIKAVKLELGSRSTLHLDTAPNYTTELLKCQRYFVRLNGVQYRPYGFAIAESATVISLMVDLPTPMRGAITVTSNGSFKAYDGSTNINITSVSSSLYAVDTKHGSLAFTASGLTVTHIYLIITSSATSYIDFSAELEL